MTYTQLVSMLQARRIDLGITQRELSRKLGVSLASPSGWERQGSCPSVLMLLNWIHALGLDITLVERED
jgi:transcriptional regulator with XRE-family HTH domain